MEPGGHAARTGASEAILKDYELLDVMDEIYATTTHDEYGLMSSCDSTAIAFKPDKLCFHVLVCYQKSSESGETAIMICRNCHNFITERF